MILEQQDLDVVLELQRQVQLFDDILVGAVLGRLGLLGASEAGTDHRRARRRPMTAWSEGKGRRRRREQQG